MRAAVALLATLALLTPAARAADVERGRTLFAEGCSTCHGLAGDGVSGKGPTLRTAGAAAADFYLSTGRMPIAEPGDEPLRAPPAYGRRDIDDLVAYVASLGTGPAIPRVHPDGADVAAGQRAFTDRCAGCHQVSGAGGVVTGGVAPSLAHSTPTEVGEAVRVGPYLMPRFDERSVSPATLDQIARYVQQVQHPDDRGGLSLGHVGPIPEGLVAWGVAAVALLAVARLLGERGRR